MALIISEPQTRKLIDMPTALKCVEKMFRDRAAGKVRGVPRRRLKGSVKLLNMMAAWHADCDLICLRAYAAEANTITLYNGRTGAIQAIIDMGYLSSLRTGAASGVAAKYLAPANAKTLGIIGPGWQATFQAAAIAAACRIERILVWGRTAKKRKAFVREMSNTIGGDWRELDSLDELEASSDILVLSTDSSTPVSDGKMLKPEVLVCSIGANATVKLQRLDSADGLDRHRRPAHRQGRQRRPHRRLPGGSHQLGASDALGEVRRRRRAQPAAQENSFPIQRGCRRRPRRRAICFGAGKAEEIEDEAGNGNLNKRTGTAYGFVRHRARRKVFRDQDAPFKGESHCRSASKGKRCLRAELHGLQLGTRFPLEDLPPRMIGTRWSMVNSCGGNFSPQ